MVHKRSADYTASYKMTKITNHSLLSSIITAMKWEWAPFIIISPPPQEWVSATGAHWKVDIVIGNFMTAACRWRLGTRLSQSHQTSQMLWMTFSLRSSALSSVHVSQPYIQNDRQEQSVLES